jgi:hypothetical protein
VTSKYDQYWAACLDQLQAALGRAAGRSPAAIATPGLRDLGARQSWYGLAEVRDSKLIRSSMAHATSLGKTVATMGICAPWPQDTFRLTVSTAGDTVTITNVGPASQAARTTPHRQPHRAPIIPAGDLPPARDIRPGPAQDTAGRAGPEEFYQLLAGLASSARRLRDCRAGDCPPAGVYFFFEDGEVRSDGTSRVVRVGTHALTAASSATLWDRLRQHRGHLAGRDPGSGNHRASVFLGTSGQRSSAATGSHRDCSHPGSIATARTKAGPARKPLSK